VQSDCAPVSGLTSLVIGRLGDAVKWMRDPTRGGLATVACELGQASGLAVTLDEPAVPVPDDVAGACEMLGLDPFYLANEGKVLMVVEPGVASEAVALLRDAGQAEAADIGWVSEPGSLLEPGAYLRTAFGGTRPLHPLDGDQLPRIC